MPETADYNGKEGILTAITNHLLRFFHINTNKPEVTIKVRKANRVWRATGTRKLSAKAWLEATNRAGQEALRNRELEKTIHRKGRASMSKKR